MKLFIALLLALISWTVVKVMLARRGVTASYPGRHRKPGPLDRLPVRETPQERVPERPDRKALGRHESEKTHRASRRLAARAAPLLTAGFVLVGSLVVAGWFAGDESVIDNPDNAAPANASPTTSIPLATGDAGDVDTTTNPGSGTTDTADAPSLSGTVIRGVFGRDSSATGFDSIKAASFNTVIVGADVADLDELAAAGLQGVVWLGNYDRTTPCEFEFPDEQIIEEVTAVAGHPAIAAYFLADEPSNARTEGCPSAPDDLRARSELVHSLDPSKPTMLTLAAWDGVEAYPYSYWVGTADIFGLVAYPCSQGDCDFEKIDQAVSVAHSVGLGEYWAIIQDFEDSWYDLPTPEEVDEQFRRWAGSDMTGYLVFAADGFSCCQASDFETNPDKRAVLEAWNRS